jgi:hypothetical protein
MEERCERYEPYGIAVSRHVALGLSGWLPEAEVLRENRRFAAQRSLVDRHLPEVRAASVPMGVVYNPLSKIPKSCCGVVGSPCGAGPERRGKSKPTERG